MDNFLNMAANANVSATTLLGASAASKKQNAGEAAKDFEQHFLSQIFRQMFEQMGEDSSMFGGDEVADVYRDWMSDAYAKSVMNSGGIGIADKVQAQLLKLQEAQS